MPGGGHFLERGIVQKKVEKVFMAYKGLIEWRGWGEEAFSEARETDKLILLGISAVWCHWCHVMDDTSYSDPEAAELINSRFIPIRVDTDRMPDVNERYNMGGWPTTAVLTPGGEVLIGATYVPPDKLKETLSQVDAFYRENRGAIKEKIGELARKKEEEQKAEREARPGDISENITAYVLEELDRHFDPVFGGFGTEPKFPVSEALDLLLTAYRDTRRKDYLEMAEKTLDGMASYGMSDQVMGGFFRYSVTRDWTVPHYEKMLESNAGLVASYLNAWRLIDEDKYLKAAKKALDYIDAWLWQPEGYFAGSQDADEEYYRLPHGERLKRTPPAVDRTMFTNLNARMAHTYLLAWETLREEKYREKALTALELMLSRMKGDGGGLYHYYDGEPRRSGLLTDQSAAVRALLLAFQLTDDRRWYVEAVSLVKFMEENHWDEEKGGYWDLPEDTGALAALSRRGKPMFENAEMSQSLKTLFVLTGNERYLDFSYKALLPYSKSYRESSYMAAVYALAVDNFLKEPTLLALTGHVGRDDMDALVEAVGGVFLPRRVLRLMDCEKDREEIEQRGYTRCNKAAAYVCRNKKCSPRIEDPKELKKSLNKAA